MATATNLTPITQSPTLETAFRFCENLAKTHYENFPVFSFFLPKKTRRDIAVIYAFARVADDIADEGNLTSEERLALLNVYENKLSNLNFSITQENIDSASPFTQNHSETFYFIFLALQEVIKKHGLPISLFSDLLKAFKQDVTKSEYENEEDILEYCKYSANPIGRILLYLTLNATADNLKKSDCICTALQLINFLQDLESDLKERHRCYLPKDEMVQFNIAVSDLREKKDNPNIKQFINTQLAKIDMLFHEGEDLSKNLKGVFGFKIKLITNCGKKILQDLYKRNSIYDRPTLKKWDFVKILFLSLFTFF